MQTGLLLRHARQTRCSECRHGSGYSADTHWLAMHTGLPSDIEAAMAASMPCFSSNCADHSSTRTQESSGSAFLNGPSKPCAMVITWAASCSMTASSNGGLSADDMCTVRVAGSVVASLSPPVRSMSLASSGATRITGHTWPFATNGLKATSPRSSRAPRFGCARARRDLRSARPCEAAP